MTVALPFFLVDISDWKISSPRLALVFTTVDDHNISYRLCSTIYHGHNHWVCRWITHKGQVWGHDGQLHQGKFVARGNGREDISDDAFMESFQQKTLSTLIYVVDLGFQCRLHQTRVLSLSRAIDDVWSRGPGACRRYTHLVTLDSSYGLPLRQSKGGVDTAQIVRNRLPCHANGDDIEFQGIPRVASNTTTSLPPHTRARSETIRLLIQGRK